VNTTRYTAVYTARTRPHNGRLHGQRPSTRHVHGRVHVPYKAVYMFVYTGRVHGGVHGPYAVTGRKLAVYTAVFGRLHYAYTAV